MERWDQRLRRIFKDKGWTAAELSRRSGVDRDSVYKYLSGKVKQPRGETLDDLARALGVAPLWLRAGVGPQRSRLQVVGYVGAGELFIPFDDYPDGAGLSEIDLDFGEGDQIAVQVRGTSMTPAYRPGDYLVGSRERGQDIGHCVGRDCIVRLKGGEGYVKTVVRGTERNRFTLVSYNDAPIENVDIDWCAPISWVKRAEQARRP